MFHEDLYYVTSAFAAVAAGLFAALFGAFGPHTPREQWALAIGGCLAAGIALYLMAFGDPRQGLNPSEDRGLGADWRCLGPNIDRTLSKQICVRKEPSP